MKIAKATEKDINAAGDAMSVLGCISFDYYPKRYGDECDDTFFDEDNPKHLRKFYDLMMGTLNAAPGWPTRVIGGMCYAILSDKNEIVDPASDLLELHPRFAQTEKERDDLLAERDALQARTATEFVEHQRELSKALDQRDELLAASVNARDMLATERQAFVDCNAIHKLTTNLNQERIVVYGDDIWLDKDDAEVVGDYDRALAQLDAAIAKVEGGAA